MKYVKNEYRGDPLKTKQFRVYRALVGKVVNRSEFDITITFEDYLDIWGDKWHLRGPKKTDLILTRLHLDKNWTKDNVTLMTLHESRVATANHVVRTPRARRGTVVISLKDLIKLMEKN